MDSHLLCHPWGNPLRIQIYADFLGGKRPCSRRLSFCPIGSLGTGDILLKIAFEDQRFFELATGCRALSIFQDTELSLPQPEEDSKLHTDIVALEDYKVSLVLCKEQEPALLVSNGH